MPDQKRRIKKEKPLRLESFVDITNIAKLTENEAIIQAARGWSARLWKDIINQDYDFFLRAHLSGVPLAPKARKRLFDKIDKAFVEYEEHVIKPLELIAAKSQIVRDWLLYPVKVKNPKSFDRDTVKGAFVRRGVLKENLRKYVWQKLRNNIRSVAKHFPYKRGGGYDSRQRAIRALSYEIGIATIKREVGLAYSATSIANAKSTLNELLVAKGFVRGGIDGLVEGASKLEPIRHLLPPIAPKMRKKIVHNIVDEGQKAIVKEAKYMSYRGEQDIYDAVKASTEYSYFKTLALLFVAQSSWFNTGAKDADVDESLLDEEEYLPILQDIIKNSIYIKDKKTFLELENEDWLGDGLYLSTSIANYIGFNAAYRAASKFRFLRRVSNEVALAERRHDLLGLAKARFRKTYFEGAKQARKYRTIMEDLLVGKFAWDDFAEVGIQPIIRAFNMDVASSLVAVLVLNANMPTVWKGEELQDWNKQINEAVKTDDLRDIVEDTGRLVTDFVNKTVTVLRTESQDAVAQAELWANITALGYDVPGAIDMKYRYVAVLDERTTQLCRSLDGQIFVVGKGPMPPQHYNCRSTTMPVWGNDEEGYQGPWGKQSKEKSDEIFNQVSIPFPAWLKRQPKNIRQEILGKRNERLFMQGKYDPPAVWQSKRKYYHVEGNVWNWYSLDENLYIDYLNSRLKLLEVDYDEDFLSKWDRLKI